MSVGWSTRLVPSAQRQPAHRRWTRQSPEPHHEGFVSRPTAPILAHIAVEEARPMSSITKVPAGYRARWRTPDGASRSKTFERKQDAQRHITQVEGSKITGAYVDTTACKTTFEQYAETWRLVQVHRPSTAAQIETHLRRHVYPHLGHRPLGQLRPSELQAWAKHLSGELAPATVEAVYRYVVAILRAAVADRVIASSPAVGIRLPKDPPRMVEPLATEVVEGLIDAVPARYQALVVLAAGTGMRQGECFGLTVDRLDFMRRQVTVDRQLVYLAGGPPMFGPPKTQASYRSIPLPAVVVDSLAAHLASFPPAASGHVFTNDASEPIKRNRFSDVWRRAVAVAEAPPGTGFDALRHYYASLLIRAGCSVKVVQSRLGHASAAETLNTYSHMWADDEDRTRSAVDGVLGARVSHLCHEQGAGS
jgi:integrase